MKFSTGMEIDGGTVSASNGHKRPPEDDLTSEQRLAKRFHLLDLDDGSNLYAPMKSPSPGARRRSNAVTDSMHVDDSKHKVYIYDLDEEIAQDGSDGERLVFLPDIEKRLAQLPKSILSPDSAPKGNEVVLYSVPESLLVPKEQDIVRRAIIESRERAREQQLQDLEATGIEFPESVNGIRFAGPVSTQNTEDSHGEDDVMDMD